jgi:hypothetical protein
MANENTSCSPSSSSSSSSQLESHPPPLESPYDENDPNESSTRFAGYGVAVARILPRIMKSSTKILASQVSSRPLLSLYSSLPPHHSPFTIPHTQITQITHIEITHPPPLTEITSIRKWSWRVNETSHKTYIRNITLRCINTLCVCWYVLQINYCIWKRRSK